MSDNLQGFRELSRKLQELGSLEGGKILKSGCTLAGTPVVRRARTLIPVGADAHRTYKGRMVAPGFAKRSIAKVAVLGRTRSIAWCMISVRPEAWYAVHFVELGTSKQPKQPWLVPAFRQTQQEQIERLGATIRRKILTVAAKRS